MLAMTGATGAYAQWAGDATLWAVCTMKVDGVSLHAPPVTLTFDEWKRRPTDAVIYDATERAGIAGREASCYLDPEPGAAEGKLRAAGHRTVGDLKIPKNWYHAIVGAASPATAQPTQPSTAKSSAGIIIEDRKPMPASPVASKTVAKPALPKPGPIDRGSAKSKCHLAGKRYVCPASKQ